MKAHKRSLQIGITFLAALIAAFFGINFLKGSSIFSNDNTYFAIYNSVSGVHISNYIYINGMKVGHVKKIDRMDNRVQKFLITISVDRDVKIPKDSRLVMYSSGFLGGTELRIDIGNAVSVLSNRDTIAAMVETGLVSQLGGEVKPAIDVITSAVVHLDSVLIAINRGVFNAQGQQNIEQSLENIRITSLHIADISRKISTLLASEGKKVENIIGNLESVTDSLAAIDIKGTIAIADSTIFAIKSVIDKIERGEGTAAMLINDKELYLNLERSAKSLEQLLEDIRLNPKRYVHFSIF